MVEEYTFSYAGKNSDDYGIIIGNVGELPETLVSGADSEIIGDSITGRSSQIVYGVQETNYLSFPLSLILPKNIDFKTVCEIKHWLFGQDKPQRLQFNHPDLQDYYYLCFLKYDNDYTDNCNYRVITLNVQCVSPYAYMKDVTFTLTSGSVHNVSIQTEELTGAKPKISFRVPSGVDEINISNNIITPEILIKSTDTKPIHQGDYIQINCQKKIVLINSVSSTKNIQLDETYGFITLYNGINPIQINSAVPMEITFNYTPTIRIGGV